MTTRLTPKQRRVWLILEGFIRRRGYAPSVRELAVELGCHPNNAHQFLRALERKGWLRRQAGARGIELVAEKSEAKAVPIVGTIAAGEPIEALTDEVETIQLGRDVIGDDGAYVLRVRGMSMRGDSILDGDLVVIRPQPTAENGDVVVVLLADGTATLKRFYWEQGRVRLQPANADYQPIYVDQPETLRIQGKVVALVRPKL